METMSHITKRLKRAERPHLVDHVTVEVKKQILGGAFEPGKTLPSESTLAGMFAVSRRVIRESMRSLASQGLVEISQGRLPRVKSPDHEAAVDVLDTLLRRGRGTLENLNEVRFAVEGEIASLAALRATETDIGKLEQAGIDFTRARTIDEAIETDMRFHRSLAEATRNPIFILLFETLSRLLRGSQRKSYREAGIEHALDPHIGIIEAVKNHDELAARAAIVHHITDWVSPRGSFPIDDT